MSSEGIQIKKTPMAAKLRRKQKERRMKQKSNEKHRSLFEDLSEKLFKTETEDRRVQKKPAFSLQMGKLYSRKRRKRERTRTGTESENSRYGTMKSVSDIESETNQSWIGQGERNFIRKDSLEIRGRQKSMDQTKSKDSADEEMFRTHNLAKTIGNSLLEEPNRDFDKSPLTNKVPGSQYKKVLKKQNRKRRREKKKDSISRFSSQEADLKLLESLGVDLTNQIFGGPGKLRTESLQDKSFKRAQKARNNNLSIGGKEFRKMKASLEGVTEEMAEAESSLKEKKTNKELLYGNRLHEWIDSSDPRIRALGRNLKAAKEYKTQKDIDHKKEVEKGIDSHSSMNKSFINLYRKKRKKKTKKGETDTKSQFEDGDESTLTIEKPILVPSEIEPYTNDLILQEGQPNEQDQDQEEEEDEDEKMDLNVGIIQNLNPEKKSIHQDSQPEEVPKVASEQEDNQEHKQKLQEMSEEKEYKEVRKVKTITTVVTTQVVTGKLESEVKEISKENFVSVEKKAANVKIYTIKSTPNKNFLEINKQKLKEQEKKRKEMEKIRKEQERLREEMADQDSFDSRSSFSKHSTKVTPIQVTKRVYKTDFIKKNMFIKSKKSQTKVLEITSERENIIGEFSELKPSDQSNVKSRLDARNEESGYDTAPSKVNHKMMITEFIQIEDATHGTSSMQKINSVMKELEILRGQGATKEKDPSFKESLSNSPNKTPNKRSRVLEDMKSKESLLRRSLSGDLCNLSKDTEKPPKRACSIGKQTSKNPNKTKSNITKKDAKLKISQEKNKHEISEVHNKKTLEENKSVQPNINLFSSKRDAKSELIIMVKAEKTVTTENIKIGEISKHEEKGSDKNLSGKVIIESKLKTLTKDSTEEKTKHKLKKDLGEVSHILDISKAIKMPKVQLSEIQVPAKSIHEIKTINSKLASNKHIQKDIKNKKPLDKDEFKKKNTSIEPTKVEKPKNKLKSKKDVSQKSKKPLKIPQFKTEERKNKIKLPKFNSKAQDKKRGVSLYEDNYKIKNSEGVARNINEEIKQINMGKLAKSQSMRGIQIQLEEIPAKKKEDSKTNFMSVKDSKIIDFKPVEKEEGDKIQSKGSKTKLSNHEEVKEVPKQIKKVNFLERNKAKIAEGLFKKQEIKKPPLFVSRSRKSQSVSIQQGSLKNRLTSKSKRKGKNLRMVSHRETSLRGNQPGRKNRSLKSDQSKTKRKIHSTRDFKGKGKTKQEDHDQTKEQIQKLKEEEFRTLKKKFLKKYFDSRKVGEKAGPSHKQKNVKREGSKKSSKKSSQRKVEIMDDLELNIDLKKEKVLQSEQKMHRVASVAGKGSEKLAIKNVRPPSPKINFIERNKILMRERIEKKKRERLLHEKQEEIRRSRFFGPSKKETSETLKLKVKESEKSLKDDLEDNSNEDQPIINEQDIEKEIDFSISDMKRAVQSGNQGIKDIIEEVIEEEKEDEKEEEEEEEEKGEPKSQEANQIDILPENEKANEIPTVISKEEIIESNSIKNLNEIKEENALLDNPTVGSKTFQRKKILLTYVPKLKNPEKEIDSVKKKEIPGWDSSICLNKSKFKKLKEYVNPMAVKPRPKPPTKEICLDTLIKINIEKEKEREMKSKLSTSLQIGQSSLNNLQSSDQLTSTITVEPLDSIKLKEVLCSEGNLDNETKTALMKEKTHEESLLVEESVVIKRDSTGDAFNVERNEQKPLPLEIQEQVEIEGQVSFKKVETETLMPKQPEPVKEPEDLVKIVKRRFGRRDAKMKLKYLKIVPLEWQVTPSPSSSPPPELVEQIYNTETIETIKINESMKTVDQPGKDVTNIVNKLMEEYDTKKIPEQDVNLLEPKEEKVLSKLEIMKERIKENREELRKEIEVEAVKMNNMVLVKNMDKFLKKGLQKKKDRSQNETYSYPVYNPKSAENIRRQEILNLEKAKLELAKETEALNEQIRLKELEQQNIQHEAKRLQDKEIDKEIVLAEDIKANIRDIIKATINADPVQNISERDIHDSSKLVEFSGHDHLVKSNFDLPLKENFQEKSPKEETQIVKDSPVVGIDKISSSKLLIIEPSKKPRESKKSIKVDQGGYFSKYKSKITTLHNYTNKEIAPKLKKVTKISSRAIKNKVEEKTRKEGAPKENRQKRSRRENKTSADYTKMINHIFETMDLSGGKNLEDIKLLNSRTLESIPSLKIKPEKQSRDLSVMVREKRRIDRKPNRKSSHRELRPKLPPMTSRGSSRKTSRRTSRRTSLKTSRKTSPHKNISKPVQKVRKQSYRQDLKVRKNRMSRRSSQTKKEMIQRRKQSSEKILNDKSLTSLEMVEMRKKGKHQIIKKLKVVKAQGNVSKSLAPKKLVRVKSRKSSKGRDSRDFSLRPVSKGNLPLKIMNKKVLRPLIKTETINLKHLNKKRSRIQPKLKPNLRSNLDQLKKLKPIKRSSPKGKHIIERARMSMPEGFYALPNDARPGMNTEQLYGKSIPEETLNDSASENSFDDFMKIEKNIRKSVQMTSFQGLKLNERLKQGNKKLKMMKLNETAKTVKVSDIHLSEKQYIDEIVEKAFAQNEKPQKVQNQRKTESGGIILKKSRKRVKRVREDIIRAAEKDAEDLEANLLRLKEEIEHDGSDSDLESMPDASNKDYFGSKIETEMEELGKRGRGRDNLSLGYKNKLLSRTLDIKATNQIQKMSKKIEKQDSLRDIMAKNRSSLQWKKDRIKEYGRVKKKEQKVADRDEKVSPFRRGRRSELRNSTDVKKKEIKKINHKFGKDSQIESEKKVSRKQQAMTDKEDSRILKTGDKYKSEKVNYDRQIEQAVKTRKDEHLMQEPSLRKSPKTYESESRYKALKKSFTMATGEQTGKHKRRDHDPASKMKVVKEEKIEEVRDKHFAELLKRNGNTNSAISIGSRRNNPNLEDWNTETNVRLRRRHTRKTDSKKKNDLHRLKTLNSKFQKELEKSQNESSQKDIITILQESKTPSSDIKRLVVRKKARSHGGSALLKGLSSKFKLEKSARQKSKKKFRDISIEIIESQRKQIYKDSSNSPFNRNSKGLSDFERSSDLVVKNKLISRNLDEHRIGTIPEFNDNFGKDDNQKNQEAKRRLRKDRVKEYGQKLKTKIVRHRKRSKKREVKELFDNL